MMHPLLSLHFFTTFMTAFSETGVFMYTSCSYPICTADWDPETRTAAVEIPVVANRQAIQSIDRNVLMAFSRVFVAMDGPYNEVFAEHIPYQVPIIVSQPSRFMCALHSDPHINTFDGAHYLLMAPGVYTAYENTDRDSKIQIRTGPCFKDWNDGACICGIVIREKNDIIRVYECDRVWEEISASPTVTIANPLREGTVIERSKDGTTIVIYFPSGTQITVYSGSSWLNLDITGSVMDQGKARGLCGNYDRNKDNDFAHPDGTVDPSCGDRRYKKCEPETFTDTWRILRSEDNLFETLPELVDDTMEVSYCDCVGDSNTVNCGIGANAPHKSIRCRACTNYRSNLAQSRWASTLGYRKRAVEYEDTDESNESNERPTPTNARRVRGPRQWPVGDNITEAGAREMCTKAIEKSKLSSECSSINTMGDYFLADCMIDILYSGSTIFLDSTTSAFRSSCQFNLAKDPANYVTNTEGKEVFKPEYFEDLCDLKCEEHGRCGEKGVCICNNGWEGINCHIQSGIGPQMNKIRSGPLCDRAQRPCKKVFIDVSNINFSDDLICRVQPVDEQGNNQGRPIDTHANFLSGYRISCDLSETTVSSKHFKVSASNDGSLFGNQLSLHVFDSVCLDCTENGCTSKTTACRIDNVCYVNGTKFNGDKNKICDVSKDTTDWTIITVCRKVQLADIIVLLDSSGSVDESEYQDELEFIAKLTENFILGPNDVRFAAITFSSNARILFHLRDHSNRHNLTDAILNAPYLRGGTNTKEALDMVRNSRMFQSASGGRDGSTKIVIVVTDGISNSEPLTLAAAKRLKDEGVQIISIGVGNNLNNRELEGMASSPDSVFLVSGFGVLDHIQEEVTKQTCG